MHKIFKDALVYLNKNEPTWKQITQVDIDRYGYLLELINHCTDKELASELYYELNTLTDEEMRLV